MRMEVLELVKSKDIAGVTDVLCARYDCTQDELIQAVMMSLDKNDDHATTLAKINEHVAAIKKENSRKRLASRMHLHLVK